jgi:pimeloyl-ACP methyl ester carboxylesterase
MHAPTALVRLSDGRNLAYADHGPSDGQPVLFFHGTPASHPNWRFFGRDSLLHRLGLRMITVDRPGMGRSTFQPDRTIADWPADIAALMDQLGLATAGVLAHSGGAAYGLACATAIPDRIRAVSLVGAAPPHYREPFREQMLDSAFGFLQLSSERPAVARLILRTMGLAGTLVPGLFVRQAASSLPPADRCVMDSEEHREAFLAMMRTTLRAGPRGAQHDAALMYGPWSLPLADITMPVDLWHGEQDRNVPVAVAHFYRDQIPGAQLTTLASDGHLSIMTKRGTQILERLRDRLTDATSPVLEPRAPRRAA